MLGELLTFLLCADVCAVQLTDPFLNVFRGIVPAVGGIDLSPMLGFFLLNFIRNLLVQYSHVI